MSHLAILEADESQADVEMYTKLVERVGHLTVAQSHLHVGQTGDTSIAFCLSELVRKEQRLPFGNIESICVMG